MNSQTTEPVIFNPRHSHARGASARPHGAGWKGVAVLFAKIYGVLILVMVGLFYVQGEVSTYIRSQTQQPVNVRLRFEGTFRLIEKELLSVPESDWPQKFREIQGLFPVPIQLRRWDAIRTELQVGPKEEREFRSQSVSSADRSPGGFFLFRKIGESDHGVVMEFVGPRDTRALTLTLNWIIQLTTFAILLVFWVRPFWRSMMVLHQAAERIGQGVFDQPVRLSRHSSLWRLGEAFNTMSGQIGRLLASQRELTSAVSHELRNPIMRLQYRYELTRNARDLADQDRNLDCMHQDLLELERLSEEILMYARLDREAPDIQLEFVEAGPWLTERIAESRELAQVFGRDIAVEGSAESVTLRMAPRYMTRAVMNLVSNALRHARTKVRITVVRDGECSLVSVDDDGAGLPPEEWERVFEPFVRLDASRDRKTGGHGIGLAIVRRIARWHGGDASVSQSAWGGASFQVRWRDDDASRHATTRS